MASKHIFVLIFILGLSSVLGMTPNFMGNLSNKLGIIDFFTNLIRGTRQTLFSPFIDVKDSSTQIEMKHQQSSLYPFYKKLTSSPYPKYQLKAPEYYTTTTELPTIFYYFPSARQIKTPKPEKAKIIYPHYFPRQTTTLTTIFTTTLTTSTTTTKKPERIVSQQPKTHVEVTYSDMGLYVMRAPNLIPFNQNNIETDEEKRKKEKLSNSNSYDETTLLPQTLRPSSIPFNTQVISNSNYYRQYNKSYQKTTISPYYLSKLNNELVVTSTTLPFFLDEDETTEPINYFPFEYTTPKFVEEEKEDAKINYLRPISTTILPEIFNISSFQSLISNENELENNFTSPQKNQFNNSINDINIGEHFQFFHSPEDNSFGFSNLDGNPGRSFFYHKRLNQMEFAVAETLNNAYTQDFVILSTENPEPVLKVGYIYRETGEKIDKKITEENAVFNPSDFEFLNN